MPKPRKHDGVVYLARMARSVDSIQGSKWKACRESSSDRRTGRKPTASFESGCKPGTATY